MIVRCDCGETYDVSVAPDDAGVQLWAPAFAALSGAAVAFAISAAIIWSVKPDPCEPCVEPSMAAESCVDWKQIGEHVYELDGAGEPVNAECRAIGQGNPQ